MQFAATPRRISRAFGLALLAASGAVIAAPEGETCTPPPRPTACRPGQDSPAEAQAALGAGRINQALSIARCVIKRPATAADLQNALQIEGVAATRSGDYRRARIALKRALKLASGNASLQGRILISLGDLFERQKQHERAQAFYRRALAVLVPGQDSSAIMDAWFQRGDIELAHGRFEEGLRAYGNALQNARTPAETARASDYLGFAQRTLGDFERALTLHGEALDAGARIADPVGKAAAEARARNHLGLSLQARALAESAEAPERALADLRAALEQETRASEVLRQHPDARRLGYVLRAIAALHLELARADTPTQRQGHLERVVAVADDALRSGTESGNAEWRGLALHGLATAHARQGQFAQAEAALARAETIWKCLDDRHSLGHANLLWAREIAAPKHESVLAQSRLEAALREFRAIHAEDDTITTLVQLGRLQQEGGDLTSAKRSYLRAIEVVERTRTALSGEDNRLTFFARRLAPYEALISLLLREPRPGANDKSRQADIDLAFAISERARARALLDHLTQQPGAPSLTPATALDLAAGELMFQYYIGAQDSTLFVLKRGQPIRAIRLDATREFVAAAVRRFRQPFEELKTHADPANFLASAASFDLATAQLLYDRLLRPGEPALGDAKQLIVVPHGPLFLLPFEALVESAPAAKEGDPGFAERLTRTRFAIDRLPPVAYTVSAQMLAQARAPRAAARDRLLAFVDPITARPPSRHAQNELRQLRQQNRGRIDIRPGAAASKQAFLRDAGNYASLYVSAHGEFNELRPWLSGFWLSDPANPAGTLVSPADIAPLKLHARLLTIRACEVGLGPVLDGEGLTGLTRALKVAGAQNLVLSLWVVDDQSSAELLGGFYRQAATGDFSNALREAKRVLKTSAPQRSHPFYWAPFVLMR